MTIPAYGIPRHRHGDILDVILTDHRQMEDLIREVRRSDSDRAAARAALAELLVAHARAEEEVVLPRAERADAITEHELEHGHEEHAEINEALLALLECAGTDTQKWDDAAEELGKVLAHHLGEEELTVINPSRAELSIQQRGDLGEAWLARRNAYLARGCASRAQVAALVGRAYDEGLLPADEED